MSFLSKCCPYLTRNCWHKSAFADFMYLSEIEFSAKHLKCELTTYPEVVVCSQVESPKLDYYRAVCAVVGYSPGVCVFVEEL